MNCGDHSPHPGHTWTDSAGAMQVCIGVPHDRWNDGDDDE